jgi:hypothetical protein
MQLKNLLAFLPLLAASPVFATNLLTPRTALVARQSDCPDGEVNCDGVCYDPSSGAICCGSGMSILLEPSSPSSRKKWTDEFARCLPGWHSMWYGQ